MVQLLKCRTITSGMQMPLKSLSIGNWTKVGIRKPDIQNPETFQIRTFWRSVFEWLEFQMVGTIVVSDPTVLLVI